MEVKGSEPQGRHGDGASGGSGEQTHEPMNKNRIMRRERRASGHEAAKPISIKGAERKFGGCVWTAVELIAGGLRRVSIAGLSVSGDALTAAQKSAEGIVGAGPKARTVRSG